MQSQFDLLGAFVPTIAAWFVLSLAMFVRSRRATDVVRLLPAVLARTTRPLRSFRLPLLRRRAGVANH